MIGRPRGGAPTSKTAESDFGSTADLRIGEPLVSQSNIKNADSEFGSTMLPRLPDLPDKKLIVIDFGWQLTVKSSYFTLSIDRIRS